MGNKLYARFAIDYPSFSLKVELELPGTGISALFGHSGSGKTTCLLGLLRVCNAPQAAFLRSMARFGKTIAEAFFFPHIAAL